MTVTHEAKPKRKIRTSEEIVADLEAQIAQVKARAAAKEAKQKPEVKPLITAVRAVDKALTAAQEAENKELAASLESVSATLGASLVEMGLRVSKSRKRRGTAA